MTKSPSLVVGCLVPALALAGCFGDSGPTYVVDNAGPVAEEGNVTAPAVLNVLVVAEREGGTPVPGAGVVFLLPGPLTATADAAGKAVGRLAPERPVKIAAGGLGDLTNELVGPVAVGGPGSTTDVTIVLFRRELAFSSGGPLALDEGLRGVASEAQGPPWKPRSLVFSPDAGVPASYRQRLVAIDVTLAWNNTASAWADLAVGVGEAPPDPTTTWDDRDERPTDATASQTASVTGFSPEGDILLGPVVDAGVAPMGVTYALTGVSRFDGDDVHFEL